MTVVSFVLDGRSGGQADGPRPVMVAKRAGLVRLRLPVRVERLYF
ncbi:hypothetical protein [Acidisoma sp. 7E03]